MVPSTRQSKAVVKGTAPLRTPDTIGAVAEPITHEADEGRASLVKAPVSLAIVPIVEGTSIFLRLGKGSHSVPPFPGKVPASSGSNTKIQAVACAIPFAIQAERNLVRWAR